MAIIPFNKEFPHEAGEVVTISPQLRRITCPNPSSFTFHGTNTYILGHGKVGIVDPGPADQGHIDRLRAVLAEKGEEVSHIIVTHTHKDHSPGVQLMKAWSDAPTYGYGKHGIGARRNWPFAGPEGGDGFPSVSEFIDRMFGEAGVFPVFGARMDDASVLTVSSLRSQQQACRHSWMSVSRSSRPLIRTWIVRHSPFCSLFEGT